MKTLKKHVILFDAECPMCGFYTNAFVKTGMLESTGRVAYQDFPTETCPMLDQERAVNEIALVNQETGEVTYGVASLLKVIGTSFTFLMPLFTFRPFIWLMSKAYAFISYNRRVIIPAKVSSSASAAQPTFKLKYRVAYLLFTWLLTGLILTSYAKLLSPLTPLGDVNREYLICGGQIFFQRLVILLLKPQKVWDYLGNMMTISFAGALLLLPVILLSNLMFISPYLCTAWFLLVAGIMLLEHIRRVSLLDLSWVMSLTWVLYRVIILILILII